MTAQFITPEQNDSKLLWICAEPIREVVAALKGRAGFRISDEDKGLRIRGHMLEALASVLELLAEFMEKRSADLGTKGAIADAERIHGPIAVMRPGDGLSGARV